jgi:hypothetical protein
VVFLANQILVVNQMIIPKHVGPFVDKLTLTAFVPKNKQKKAQGRFFKLLQKGKLRDYQHTKQKPYKQDFGTIYTGHEYEHSGFIYYGGSKSKKVFVQISPLNKLSDYKQNFMRVELNPRRFTPFEQTQVVNMVRHLACPPALEPITSILKVTRVDYAIDFKGLNIADILVRVKGFRKCKYYCNENTGKIESIYIGSARRIVKVYDKVAEMNKNREFVVVGKQDICRVEILLRPNCTIDELLDLKNPFTLNVYRRNLSRSDFDDDFLEQVNNIGLQEALKALKKGKKQFVLKRLSKYEIDLFDSKVIWSKKAVNKANKMWT